MYLQASALAVALIPLFTWAIFSFKSLGVPEGWLGLKGEGGEREESVAFPRSKGNISTFQHCSPSIPGTQYLQELLLGNWSIWISALKNITPIRLGISPKVAPEQGRRSMLFNIKLFTKMTFIMLMAKSHWLWRSQNEVISKGCDSPSKRHRSFALGARWISSIYFLLSARGNMFN